VISTNELKALVALAGVEQGDIAKAMSCSHAMISKTINNPERYPIKSMQIHLLLREWAEESGFKVIAA
jgi:hypothetical protein